MLTPEWLESCPDRLVKLYEQAERDIVADIARKLNSYDYFVSSAEWQAMKLQELNNTQKDIIDKLSKASGKTKTEIIKLLKEAGVKSLKDDTAKPTKATQNLLNTGLRRTLGSFDNLTRTTAINGTKQISEALDRAYMQVSTGAFSQEAAVKTAIKDLCRNGIETYRYPSHTDYIDVVVRRAVRTGINQTAAAISLSNAEQLNTDLVEVTAHSGARPSHAEWQGKVFSVSGDTDGYEKLSEATGYGTVTGLCGANCRHTFHPFFEGDERMYSDEELKEMDAPKYEYNGEKLTEYEATQRQRYIERKIRRWKRENAAMKAAGLDATESAAKVKHWSEVQADFIGQTGLKRQYGREEVVNVNKTLEKSEQGGIIDIEIDEFTPCLIDNKTGDVLDTVAVEITDRNLLKQYNERNGWHINWSEVPKECTISAIKIKGDEEVQGLAAFRIDNANYAVEGYWIVAAPHNRGNEKKYKGVGGHLYAVMLKASVEAGFDGFFYGKAANQRLLKHYIDVMGAKPIDSLRFFIDEMSAKQILDIYTFERGE